MYHTTQVLFCRRVAGGMVRDMQEHNHSLSNSTWPLCMLRLQGSQNDLEWMFGTRVKRDKHLFLLCIMWNGLAPLSKLRHITGWCQFKQNERKNIQNKSMGDLNSLSIFFAVHFSNISLNTFVLRTNQSKTKTKTKQYKWTLCNKKLGLNSNNSQNKTSTDYIFMYYISKDQWNRSI